MILLSLTGARYSVEVKDLMASGVHGGPLLESWIPEDPGAGGASVPISSSSLLVLEIGWSLKLPLYMSQPPFMLLEPVKVGFSSELLIKGGNLLSRF